MREEKNPVCPLSIQQRAKKKYLCNFQSLYCSGSRFCDSRRKILYIFFIRCVGDGEAKGREKNVISILLARQKPCTRNLVDDFYSRGMLLPYYKLSCPHMDFFLVVDWKHFFHFISLARSLSSLSNLSFLRFYDFSTNGVDV